MTHISLNQTESEKRLHRILYYLKFFRATVLRWVLLILAIVFYMAFGITGLDPIANGIINGLRPVIADSQQSLYFVSAVLIIVVLIGVAGGTLLYKSIVRVWRKSLKAQSIFVVIFILLPRPFFDGQLFLFSYNHFDLLFTILFGLSSVFIWWWFADIAIGLWKVSTTPEVSSFVATLDPRLTTGFWTHCNKLLDNPELRLGVGALAWPIF